MSSQNCSITEGQKRDEKINVIKEKGRSLEVKKTMWRYYNSPRVDGKEGKGGPPQLAKVPKQSKPDQSQSKSDDSKPKPNKPRRSERLKAKRLRDDALH
ncbi:hypothetical protein V493_01226 [Pseudogymnoascus sp. VKM F-4281 (FW-2241)]|nr:hypothetical protein V493_01226 [Pseudogymnoascus sp. VKM F-4281 (FW-2241)]